MTIQWISAAFVSALALCTPCLSLRNSESNSDEADTQQLASLASQLAALEDQNRELREALSSKNKEVMQQTQSQTQGLIEKQTLARTGDLTALGGNCPVFCNPPPEYVDQRFDPNQQTIFCVAKPPDGEKGWKTLSAAATLTESGDASPIGSQIWADLQYWETNSNKTNKTDSRNLDKWCKENKCVAFLNKCVNVISEADLKDMYGKTWPIDTAQGQDAVQRMLQAGTGQQLVLSLQFLSTQPWVTYCGITTTAFVLNILRVQPVPYIGMYAWWTEKSIFDMVPNIGVLINQQPLGMSLPDIRSSIQHIAGSEQVPTNLDIERSCQPCQNMTCTQAQLVDDIKKASENPREYVVMGAYKRSELGQKGGGHWSPITGFLAASSPVGAEADLTFILDVARFKYQPQLVKVDDLFKAMKTIDTDTNECRGWLLVRHKIVNGKYSPKSSD